MKMTADKASAILLAGGRSTRMGQDKSRLVIKGMTLLDHQAARLARLGINDIMVSGPCAPSIEGVRNVEDIYKDRGPLGGLHACLKGAKNPGCLVLSVDVPLVPLETLKMLMELHDGDAADCTVLTVRGRPEPLIGVYSSSLHKVIAPLIARGGAPVRALLDRVRVKGVEYGGDEALLLNCNTPEDYERLKLMI